MQTDSSFDTDTTAYKMIGKLSELRQQNDAIAYGTTTIRYSNDDVLIYERKFYDDVILVAINRQPDKAYTIDNVETLLPEGEYVDFLGGMLNGENISVYASTGINTTASITLDGGEVGVWQYDAAASAPEIGNVVSTMGRAGNRVYIYGDGLDGNISVKFGETEATVESNTANEIVTYVPDNAVAGYNDITVTKGDAVSNSFTYNVLSGDQNQVIFHVKAESNYGENIYIVHCLQPFKIKIGDNIIIGNSRIVHIAVNPYLVSAIIFEYILPDIFTIRKVNALKKKFTPVFGLQCLKFIGTATGNTINRIALFEQHPTYF